MSEAVPGKTIVVDGHHRVLASERLGRPVLAYVATVHADAAGAPWRTLHSLQRRGSSIGSFSVEPSIPPETDANAAAPEPRADWKPREELGKFAKAEHSEVVATPHGEAHVQLRVMPGGEHVFSARARSLDGKVSKPQHVRVPAGEATPERLEAEAGGKRTMGLAPGLPHEVRAQAHALAYAMGARAAAMRASKKADAADVAPPIDQCAALCLVFDDQGRVLTVSRPEPPNEMAIPGGMVDPGEGPDTAAARELLEECGVVVRELRYVTQIVSPDGRPVQLFVAGSFEGTAHAAEPNTRVAWMTAEDLVRQAVVYRPCLEMLVDTDQLKPQNRPPPPRSDIPRADRPPNAAESDMGGIHVQQVRANTDADDQPRVPSGSPDGGQFAGKDAGGSGGASAPASAETYFKADRGRLGRLHSYTEYDYAKMNEFMRDPVKYAQAHGARDADSVHDKSQALLSDLKGAPKEPGVASRGVMLPKEAIAKLTPGSTTVARGFWSATKDAGQAQGFAHQTAQGAVMKGDKRQPVLLHITHRSGVSLGAATSRPEEKEVLIPHGTRLHVDKTERTGGMLHIHMSEVPA